MIGPINTLQETWLQQVKLKYNKQKNYRFTKSPVFYSQSLWGGKEERYIQFNTAYATLLENEEDNCDTDECETLASLLTYDNCLEQEDKISKITR